MWRSEKDMRQQIKFRRKIVFLALEKSEQSKKLVPRNLKNLQFLPSQINFISDLNFFGSIRKNENLCQTFEKIEKNKIFSIASENL